MKTFICKKCGVEFIPKTHSGKPIYCSKSCCHSKHRMSGTRIYRIWATMNNRCTNASQENYYLYGGRGIKVEWHSFDDFYKDMSASYEEGLSIDRIDVNGNYCKENCRWATPKEQANNRRSNHFLTFQGKTHSISDWSRLSGLTYDTIKNRIYRGWSVDRVFQEVLII